MVCSSGNESDMAENGIRLWEKIFTPLGWFRGRQATNCRVEATVSVDSGGCTHYGSSVSPATDPCVRGVELVPRQKRGDYGRKCPHANTNELFDAMCDVLYGSEQDNSG